MYLANITEGGVPIIGTQQLEVRRNAVHICTITVPVLCGENTKEPLLAGFDLALPDYAEQIREALNDPSVSIHNAKSPFTIHDDPIEGSSSCQILDEDGKVVGSLRRPLLQSEVKPLYN